MRVIERKKTKDTEHVDSDGSWAISYGDMVTLLLSFFVLYFTVDQSKVKANQLQQSLMVRLQEGGVKSDQTLAESKLNIARKPGEGVDPELMEQFGAQVHKNENQLIVDFQNISFFEFGQVDLNSEGTKALNNFAKMYQAFSGQYTLRIQAYTDTRKVRSANLRFKDNLELSALRSVASMRALQKSGVPLSKMKIAGYGELAETQEKLMQLRNEKDPLKYTRKVVLVIEPQKERN
ncbi:MAG: hypothetical protein A2Z20_01000 [Bdellovibrionales bacterium RBG_16_40_8]|nr:MAG: hypothetical protein A2Z20_01000 [Bdellovibrionales bacterium RBG_16_40_8]